MPRVLVIAVCVFVVNVPFGFWRAGARKLSVPWFVAVHAPVPLVILARWASGLGFQLATVPVFAGAFFAGQIVGGRLRRCGRSLPCTPPPRAPRRSEFPRVEG